MANLIPPALDYANLGQDHLRMVLEMSLSLFGVPATVTHPHQAETSDYTRDFAEEDQYSDVPDEECTVLVSEAGLVGSFTLQDVIDLETRLDADIILTTFHPLQQRDRVNIQMPDGKTLSVVVTSPHAYHGLHTYEFMWHCRVI